MWHQRTMGEYTMAYFWFAAALLAVVAELFSGAFFMLVVAVGLGAAGAAAWLAGDSWPELPWWVASTVMLSGFSLLWRRRKAKQLVAALPDADIGQAVQVVLWRDEQHARVRYRGTEWEARLVEGERLGQGHESYLIAGRDGHEWLLRCQTKPTNEANNDK